MVKIISTYHTNDVSNILSLQRKANAVAKCCMYCTALHVHSNFFSFLFEILLEEGRIIVLGQSRSQLFFSFFFFNSVQQQDDPF